MNTILVNAGEAIRICFASGKSECLQDTIDDGSFEIHYDSPDFPKQVVVRETSGLPGSVYGEANSLLYIERFADDAEAETCDIAVGVIMELPEPEHQEEWFKHLKSGQRIIGKDKKLYIKIADQEINGVYLLLESVLTPEGKIKDYKILF